MKDSIPCEQSYRPPSLLENLKRQQAELQERLGRINEALEACEKHPDVAEALNAVSRVL